MLNYMAKGILDLGEIILDYPNGSQEVRRGDVMMEAEMGVLNFEGVGIHGLQLSKMKK